MPSSPLYPNYCNAQLLHQWSAKNGSNEAKIEVKEEPGQSKEAQSALSKMERLQYVGGIRRIDFKREESKGTDIDSPMGQDRLAKMNLMQSSKK